MPEQCSPPLGAGVPRMRVCMRLHGCAHGCVHGCVQPGAPAGAATCVCSLCTGAGLLACRRHCRAGMPRRHAMQCWLGLCELALSATQASTAGGAHTAQGADTIKQAALRTCCGVHPFFLLLCLVASVCGNGTVRLLVRRCVLLGCACTNMQVRLARCLSFHAWRGVVAGAVATHMLSGRGRMCRSGPSHAAGTGVPAVCALPCATPSLSPQRCAASKSPRVPCDTLHPPSQPSSCLPGIALAPLHKRLRPPLTC